MRYGIVSTYPPTQCGIATFSASLRAELVQPDDGGSGTIGGTNGGTNSEAVIVRLVEKSEPRPSVEVAAQLVAGDPVALRNAAACLDECDVAIIQHEYGIYGGEDGQDVLELLDAVHVPTVVVLHTVPLAPTLRQRAVLEAVVAKGDRIVTMSMTARDRLAEGYAIDMRKVSLIAHGAPARPATASLTATFRSGRPTILTWGLLGPGKGIEWGIDAMALLRDLNPAPRYVIAGQTHPKVAAREGEAYRTSLQERARRHGLGDCVEFDGHYRDGDALARLVQSADVVLLPYDSLDQVTSGVLIEAVAAGKPVVATRFPHAVELLGNGSGIVVAHRRPDEIAGALRNVLTHGGLAAEMSRAAALTAPALSWAAVAAQYRTLGTELVNARIAA